MNGAPGETTVLVAIRAPQVREALVAIIGALEGYHVVGEAECDDDALRLAQSLRPTLALVDQDLPPTGGAWTIQRLRGDHLTQVVVAMGLRADDGARRRARAAGAEVFLQTGATVPELVAALDQAVAAKHTSIAAHGSPEGRTASSHLSKAS